MQILLPIHIISGVIALASAVSALSFKKGKNRHFLSGKIFFWAMLGIFITAIPMSIINENIFLVFVAIFSFYLAFSGMRFGRNRAGIATPLDWIAVGLMVFSGVGMWILSINYFMNENSQYIVLLVFGFLAISLGYNNFRTYRNKTATGKERIEKHLTNMMGGTIAVVTAVLVVNPPSDPEWVWWVLPTALIVPGIFWWVRKVGNSQNDY